MSKRNRSYYVKNPENILHPTLRNYSDALVASEQDTVWIVYFRVNKRIDKKTKDHYYELTTRGEAKVGKGFLQGGETRDPSAGGSSGILETWAAIPVVNEEAAYALEELAHNYLIKSGRHVERVTNESGKQSGTEWFDGWSADRDTAVREFNTVISAITRGDNVGRGQFTPRYYQTEASDLLSNFLPTTNKESDFYLLMKPRAGKNATAVLGAAKFVQSTVVPITIDFLSQWPSAFAGLINDINQFKFVDGVRIAAVNTQAPDWELQYLAALKTNDIVFRLSSVQSIIKFFTATDDAAELEDETEEYDEHKAERFLALPTRYCAIDESDHGMRTEKSQTALGAFGYTKRIWMSGTDLYAIRHLARPGNHYLYDMIQEIQDVKAGVFGDEVRSLIRKHALEASILPYDELTPDLMSAQEVTRRITNLFKTDAFTGRVRYDSVINRVVDSTGTPVRFSKPGEVLRLLELIYYWDNTENVKPPEDHKHIFWCMPSVASCYALFNMISSGEFKCEHRPLLANMYRGAATIEEDVNADMRRYPRTMFITVGRMLRGAKAPWSAVVRCDDRSDWKVGHQLELRGQNTSEPYFDVYDANVFRAESMTYELIRSRTNGKKMATEGRKLFNLIPMTRKGEFTSTETTWEDIVESWQAGSIREGYRRESLLNESGLLKATQLLVGVDKFNDAIKAIRDDRSGKLGKIDKPPSSGGVKERRESDPLRDLKQQAITIATFLPTLVILSDGNYTEIDELVNNTSDELFADWLKHCGINHTGPLKTVRKLIINLFDAELINNQLEITARRYKNDGPENFDWTSFNRVKEGDVSTPATVVTDIMEKITSVDWKIGAHTLDVSCGTGEFCVWLANKHREMNLDPSEFVFYADTSPINLRITSIRLDFDNGFLYNEGMVI